MLIAGGLMTMADGRRLIRHFMKVNRCTRAAFDRHEKRAAAEWLVRRKKAMENRLGAVSGRRSGGCRSAQTLARI
jgi:hypothetical protein